MADENDLSAEQTSQLAHFQEIVGIDSLDECRQILEVFEWNIESAVQSTFGDQVTVPALAAAAAAAAAAPHTTSLNDQAATSDAARDAYHNELRTNRPQLPTRNQLARQGSQQPLPNVNLFTQRTLSYHGQRDQAVVPRGFFQWSLFIISLPFKLIFSSLVDLASFFWSFFESDRLPIGDYDPLANVAEFVIDYNQRFGTNHPDFYQGSYNQAVNEAKRDLKFLLVFINQNDHKDSNTLATETMNNPDIVQFLNNNFLVWACSKNLSEGRKVFNALKVRRCPFLGIIALRHSRMTLISKIEGPITAAELIVQLANLVAECEPELVAARHDREQRSQTQMLRLQQDEAYEESLRADREKAKRRQELEDETRRALEQEQRMQDEEEAKKNNILTRKSDMRMLMSETQQPDASDPQAIKLVFKLPTGTRIERVFLKSDPLGFMYKFVFCHEECPHSFEIVKNFPRQVIECTESTDTRISDHGINQPMLLFVNDRDA